MSCERDQTCSMHSVRYVSLLSHRIQWVDDPRGMSRSTPSMTARLFIIIIFFLRFITDRLAEAVAVAVARSVSLAAACLICAHRCRTKCYTCIMYHIWTCIIIVIIFRLNGSTSIRLNTHTHTCIFYNIVYILCQTYPTHK